MFLAYSMLYFVGVVLAAPYYAWRYRGTHFLRASWRERLGYLPGQFRQEQSGAIWVHSVSVGETLAISGLVQAIWERHPARKIFISHITPTGRQAGEKRLPGLTGRFYLPLDLRCSVRRALASLRPALLLIAETELWPNLLREAHRAGATVVLVNARISDRSFSGYRRFAPLTRRVFESVDWIFAQTARDAERFQALGAEPSRVLIMGNLKFDGKPIDTSGFPQRLHEALAAARRHPVMIAASTMPGEEELVLRAWEEVYRAHPRGLLILAPRHPPRFERVAQLLSCRGIPFVCRSSLPEGVTDMAEKFKSPSVVLLDSIGELAGVFEAADVVFIGGSLVNAGGHNLLEPASCGKPVLFGPHMENFRDAAEIFLDARAAIRVQKPDELSPAVLQLLEDGERRRSLGESARRLIEQGSGATQRILERISKFLGEQKSSPEPV